MHHRAVSAIYGIVLFTLQQCSFGKARIVHWNSKVDRGGALTLTKEGVSVSVLQETGRRPFSSQTHKLAFKAPMEKLTDMSC